ncbi:MAG: serine/threonine-protein kinase [Gaiellaceae bacterium]
MSSVAIAPNRELVLGRYRAVRPLGSGGSGSVWLARDEQNGLDVALKIIPREGKAAARAEREAQAARRLRHERCVRAYDVGHDASHVYIAYEYVPGRTVREALRSDSVSDQDAVEIAAQILDALAHAHRTGIVHRDVKPSNVLLEDGDEIGVRLLDFGLAQFDGADTLTAAGDVPGTLAYIAPERLAGADATAESDVWSVGVLLWEALVGRHPFWGLPLQEVARAIEAGAPSLATERRELPRRLIAAVDAALDPDPVRRPRASALAADLRSVLRPGGARASTRTVSSDAAEPAARGRALVERLAPVALAGATAVVGATLLPFWPPVLVVLLVALAAGAAWIDPRLGLVVALAAPVFPLGNVAQSAAVLYGVLAVGWLAVVWRDARNGLLFVCGPLLAPLGLLALAPLCVQPASGPARRGAQAAVAILTAALVTGVVRGELPITSGSTTSLGIAPRDSLGDVAGSLWSALVLHPGVVVAAIAAAAAAAGLSWVRSAWRHGIAALGLAMVAGAMLAGVGVVSALIVAAVWIAVALVWHRPATPRPTVTGDI